MLEAKAEAKSSVPRPKLSTQGGLEAKYWLMFYITLDTK